MSQPCTPWPSYREEAQAACSGRCPPHRPATVLAVPGVHAIPVQAQDEEGSLQPLVFFWDSGYLAAETSYPIVSCPSSLAQDLRAQENVRCLLHEVLGESLVRQGVWGMGCDREGRRCSEAYAQLSLQPAYSWGPQAVQDTPAGWACPSSVCGGEHGLVLESRACFSRRLWVESRLFSCPEGTLASTASKSSQGLPNVPRSLLSPEDQGARTPR